MPWPSEPAWRQANVMQQRLIFDLLAVPQSGRPEADEVEKVLGKKIALAGRVRNGEARLLPRAIEERDGAMVENIEERRGCSPWRGRAPG
jgi:hypothetical protein